MKFTLHILMFLSLCMSEALVEIRIFEESNHVHHDRKAIDLIQIPNDPILKGSGDSKECFDLANGYIFLSIMPYKFDVTKKINLFDKIAGVRVAPTPRKF